MITVQRDGGDLTFEQIRYDTTPDGRDTIHPYTYITYKFSFSLCLCMSL